jgi:phosphate-selective porin OprO/OprP
MGWAIVLAVSFGLVAADVAAEPQRQTTPTTQEPPAAPITAGWQDGFVIQSANADYRLLLGMVAQADGRFSLDDPPAVVNTFSLRKLRPTFSGRLARYFEFKVMPDFGNGVAVVPDAYLDIRFSAALRVRMGKDKTPVGYELMQGDAFLWFPERSLASSLVPNRDIGVQLQGDLAGGRIGYATGIFNGVPDGSSSTTELDLNSSKDFAGRIVVFPWRVPTGAPRPLGNFGFHVGMSRGRQDGPLPTFRTSVNQTFFTYVPGVSADGIRHRVSPAVFYYYKWFGGFGEYVRSSQTVSRGSAIADISNQAWHATASILLNGAAVSYGMIRPTRDFDPANGQWGALQILARYSTLEVDPLVFAAALAAPGASRRTKSFTIAANWFPSGFIKYYATYERTTFDALARPRSPENVIFFRAQLNF